MKIAFLTNHFPKLSETFVLNQITGLIDLGHEVRIFALEGNSEAVMHSDVQQYQLLSKTHRLDTPQTSLGSLGRGCWAFARMLLANPRWLRRAWQAAPKRAGIASRHALIRMDKLLHVDTGPVDVIQCHFATVGMRWGPILKDFCKAKLVVMLHGVDLREAEARGPAIYEDLFAATDVFLSISDYTTSRLRQWGVAEERIVKHPVGIQFDLYAGGSESPRQQAEKRPVVILTVARLAPEKGIVYGIRAVDELKAARPDLDLVYNIIGDGELRHEIGELINALGLSGTVHLLGAKSSSEVTAALREADIFLLPSVAEVLPVSLMEAQAAALPVVVTDVGAVNEVVSDQKTGYIAPPRDVSAIADGLADLADDPERRYLMGRAGRELVRQRYDVDKLNRRLVQIYEDVIEGRLPKNA